MAHLRPRTVAAFLALVPIRAAAHGNLLVYGAADDGTADALATAGHTVTVWDDGTWRAAAQADFETYDAIVIPSGGCGGAAPTAFDALHATRAVWGPATTGFVLVSGQLPECHLDTAAAGQLIDYAADWAAMGPGTGLVVWSDHGTRGLDFMTGVGAFSSAAGAADVFGSIDATHGAWGGLGQSQLEGWGDSAVSTITAWPSDFEVVLSDASGQTVAVARDSCDWDIDGFLAQGATCGGTDCDDRAFRVYPGAPEDCDGIDDDCNGIVDDSPSIGGTMFHADSDGDGFGDPAISVVECAQPTGHVADGSDCDDTRADVSPAGTEVCDGAADEDCDGTVDETDASDAASWYRDADGDGHGDAGVVVVSCDVPSGYVADDTDCDDASATAFPGGLEICDGLVDEDCDGAVDEDDASDARTWHRDFDMDGFGDPLVRTTACREPSGYVSDDTDCNDALPTAFPGAEEIWYDGIDQDCAGIADDDDADGDGHDAQRSGGLDCDDSDPAISPDAQERWYDGVDQDCDAASDFDADRDGFDAEAHGGPDCDDGDPEASPVAVEVWYDGIDQDCDGASDHDADRDGFALDEGDCDDANPETHPGAPEVLDDGVDQDCDGRDEISPEPEDTGRPVTGSASGLQSGDGRAGSCQSAPGTSAALLPFFALVLGRMRRS